MIVIYSMSHTDPLKPPGAVTRNGTTERAVARVAFEPFKAVLEREGHKVVSFQGSVNAMIGCAKRAIRKAKEERVKWCSVALHYNQTPMTVCSHCGKKTHAGFDCGHCGEAPRRKWKLGHMCLVHRDSVASCTLGDSICDELSVLMPWSPRKSLVLIPNSRYRSGWVRWVYQPTALVEAGFANDPKFASWIEEPENQEAYGEAVARAMIAWHTKRKKISLANWAK